MMLHNTPEAAHRLETWRQTLPIETYLNLVNAEPYRDYDGGERPWPQAGKEDLTDAERKGIDDDRAAVKRANERQGYKL